jgi:hypothetical protein
LPSVALSELGSIRSSVMMRSPLRGRNDHKAINLHGETEQPPKPNATYLIPPPLASLQRIVTGAVNNLKINGNHRRRCLAALHYHLHKPTTEDNYRRRPDLHHGLGSGPVQHRQRADARLGERACVTLSSVSLKLLCLLLPVKPRCSRSVTSVKQPASNPLHRTVSHECTRLWPGKDVGSQQTPNLAYNGTHSMVKRGRHGGGIWASIVRGCAAR